MIREMFLYYYGEHSQDVYNYEIVNGGTFIGLRGTDEAEGFKGAVRGEEGNRPVDKGYWGRVYA